MEQLKPPSHLSFEGNLAENRKEWMQGFRLYLISSGILIASGIDEKADNVNVARFLHIPGVEARRNCNTFNIPEEDVDKLYVLIQCFKDYVEPRRNLTYVRHIFFTGRQRQHSIVEITQKNVRYPAVVVFFGVSDFLIFSKCLSYTDYYDLKKKKTL